jgi:hypothetical protein
MPVAFFLASDQPVLHAGRRATFLHMSRGKAIIRYWEAAMPFRSRRRHSHLCPREPALVLGGL